ncbi:septal ring lytic transglycosylase RlpA family protein [Propionivibrio limicola]|uniref:septal ring lytic transglycosylase RlpA family protein n=1 Tax=Propionivibrio limicola TaxID=167645 RepID=UPI001292466F|nr:septal ring lytic transglycosylase RlpA family protein [Propionivibrio limicola]
MRNRRSATLVILLLLAGCGGQPARIGDGTPAGTEAEKSSTKTARKPAVTLKRGGGYYKDDGPGDDIPDNLDDIPDAQPRLEALHRFANRPYVVLGKSYVPATQLQPFRERGIASWYGKKFHGQKTSIGEPYDMFSMTAAHPTLAIPSYVRVTNVSNGKSVVVRVTDRGPFHADRVIDLSYAAAYRLDYINNGSTQVEVESIIPDGSLMLASAPPTPAASLPKPPTTTQTAGRDEIEMLASKLSSSEITFTPQTGTSLPPVVQKGVFLQLGAFSSADNAESLRSHLSRELDWLTEGIQINAGGGIHRVHLGPYPSRADAEKVAEKIRLALGYKPAFVTR